MHTLKKGILLGLGIHDVNKKQVEDFVEGLYRKGHVSRAEAEELAKVIMEKAKDANTRLESRIENYVRELVKKQELANIEHIEYLEKRLELLEEELDKAVLEKDISNMSDEELEAFLKEVGIKPEDLYKGTRKNAIYDSDEGFEEDLNKIEVSDDVIDELLSMSEEDLEKLLKEERRINHGLRKEVDIEAARNKHKKNVAVEYFTPKSRKKKAKKQRKVKAEKKEIKVEVFTPKPRGKSKRMSALAKLREELKKVKKNVAETEKATKKLKKNSATKDDVNKVKKTVVKTGKAVKEVKENVTEKVEKVEEKVKKSVVKKVSAKKAPKNIKKKAKVHRHNTKTSKSKVKGTGSEVVVKVEVPKGAKTETKVKK